MELTYIYSMVLRRSSTATPWFEDYLAAHGETAKLAIFTKNWNEYNTRLNRCPSHQTTSTDLEITSSAEFTETEFYSIFYENLYNLSDEERSIYREFLAYNKNNGIYNLTTMSEFYNGALYDPIVPYKWLESTDEDLKQQFRNTRTRIYSDSL